MRIDGWTVAYLVIALLFAVPLCAHGDVFLGVYMGVFWGSLAVFNEAVDRLV
jgi:hypothetical protein